MVSVSSSGSDGGGMGGVDAGCQRGNRGIPDGAGWRI